MKILFFKEGGKMLTKKKKIFIVCGMVALLVVTGCLNLFLNKQEDNVPTATYESASLITSYRLNKQEAREQIMEKYELLLSSAVSNEQIAEANAMISDLSGRMEKEIVLEGMIMASGYDDAVVTNSDGTYTVMVKSDNFTVDDASKILAILVRETGVEAKNVRISAV